MKSVESVSAKEEKEEEVVATAAAPSSSPLLLGDVRLVVAVANASEFVIVFFMCVYCVIRV